MQREWKAFEQMRHLIMRVCLLVGLRSFLMLQSSPKKHCSTIIEIDLIVCNKIPLNWRESKAQLKSVCESERERERLKLKIGKWSLNDLMKDWWELDERVDEKGWNLANDHNEWQRTIEQKIAIKIDQWIPIWAIYVVYISMTDRDWKLNGVIIICECYLSLWFRNNAKYLAFSVFY